MNKNLCVACGCAFADKETFLTHMRNIHGLVKEEYNTIYRTAISNAQKNKNRVVLNDRLGVYKEVI